MAKGDKDMQVAVEESSGNVRDQLSLKQVKHYADRHTKSGHAEYNNGSILVKSKHPLDQCLKRGIIEQQHHDSGKRIRNYRDCALSESLGRTYNATGEGDPEMDAATVYAIVMRAMHSASGTRNYWKLISLVCFTEPDINGEYFSERENGFLYELAPNIQRAFEASDDAFIAARDEVKSRIVRAKASEQ